MPFSGPVIGMMKKDCVSLQVHKPIKFSEKIIIPLSSVNIRKRVCLFISPISECKGSVTIETTISLLIFMLVVLFMESFMLIINTEIAMQINIDNIARNTAKNMLYLDAVDEISENNEALKGMKERIQEKMGEKSVEIPEETIDEGYLSVMLIKEIGKNSFHSKSFLGEVRGLNVTDSRIENGNINIIVNYKIKVPLVNKYLSITQRTFVKDWTGSDISASRETVYITESGEVYHRTKECSHLIIHISKTTVSQAKSNYNRKKYSGCDYCVNEVVPFEESVFVTQDGDKYHTSLRCRGLTRRVIEIDISQMEGRRPCSECG